MTDGAPHSATYSFEPIAWIKSCYPDRFGIPRQAGLVPSATAQIIFENTEQNRLSLRGIEEFSHLWVLFIFHRQNYKNWKPLVNPPRLGGKQSVGVYATRSPNRLNPIGMSAVQFSHLETTKSELRLHITGGDFLDQTPVIDIKPYVPYSDAIANASKAWATAPTPMSSIQWGEEAWASLSQISQEHAQFQALVEETLLQDPRPGYERGKDGKAGARWFMSILDYDIAWSVHNDTIHILHVNPRNSNPRNSRSK